MTCTHQHPEPVTLSSGEHVAYVCADCLDDLPLGFDCDDCSWVEVRRMCDPAPTRRLGQPCAVHA